MPPNADTRRALLMCGPACLAMLLLNVLPAADAILAQAPMALANQDWSSGVALLASTTALCVASATIEIPLALTIALLILRSARGANSAANTAPAWLVAALPLGFFWRILFGGTVGFSGDAISPLTFAWEVWRTLPLSVLLFYAFLRQRGTAVREAAWLDTRSRTQRFFRFYIPLARPAILVMLGLRVVDFLHSTGSEWRGADAVIVWLPLLAAVLALAATVAPSSANLHGIPEQRETA